ncbi:T9SS type A sorting domain-containing protein [Saccharicrinis aurantiacus]|uniref:T9SS type A sorting domain-containing protein n=1 Tax=Saccharicrinis aurantiacus TaxID=1849719 RepID=UPI00094FB45B|nr:T9SS type A sorting domain-containing protein [Saccharicrinis aurantiacus]
MRPFYIIFIVLLCFSATTYAKSSELHPYSMAYSIVVKHNFEAFCECDRLNPDPNFNYAKIGLKYSELDELFDEVEISETSQFNQEFYFDSILYWNGTGFYEDTTYSDLISKLAIKTRTENIPDHEDKNETISLNINLGSIEKTYSYETKCSGNWNSNKEGYTMTTTVSIDDPIHINSSYNKRLNINDELILYTNNYKSFSNTIVYLQVARQNSEDWETIKEMKQWRETSIRLTYEEIAGLKSNPNSKYYEWLSKGLKFRFVKKLCNGKYTSGTIQSNYVFIPDGLNYRIEQMYRSNCEEGGLNIIAVIEDDIDYNDYSTGDLQWKLGVSKTSEGLDDDGNMFPQYVTALNFEFENIEDNRYKLLLSEASQESIDTILGGLLDNIECGVLLDAGDYRYNIQEFTMPPKAPEIEAAQKALVEGESYHFYSTEKTYAIIDVDDPFELSTLRMPYIFKNNTEVLGSMNREPILYDELSDDKIAEYDAKFEAHFTAMCELENGPWALHLREKYDEWYILASDGEPYYGTVPSKPKRTIGFSNDESVLHVFTEDKEYFYTGEYRTYQSGGYTYYNCEPSNCRREKFNYRGVSLEDNYLSDDDFVYCGNPGDYHTITATSTGISFGDPGNWVTYEYDVDDGVDEKLFIKDNDSYYLYDIGRLEKYYIGPTASIYSFQLSEDGEQLVYNKGDKLYYCYREWEYNTTTQLYEANIITKQISSREVDQIFYFDGSVCYFDNYDHDENGIPITYELNLSLPSYDYIFNNDPDFKGWRDSYKQTYKQTWLESQFGYRLSGLDVNTDYQITLMDADSCSYEEFSVRINVPTDYSFSVNVIQDPSTPCSKDGKVNVTYNYGLDNTATINGQTVTVGNSVEIGGLSYSNSQIMVNTSFYKDGEKVKETFHHSDADFSEKNIITEIWPQSSSSENGKIEVSYDSYANKNKTFTISTIDNQPVYPSDSENEVSISTTKTNVVFDDLLANDYLITIQVDTCYIDTETLTVANEVFSISPAVTNATTFADQPSVIISANNKGTGDITWGTGYPSVFNATQSSASQTYTNLAADSYLFPATITDSKNRVITDTVSFKALKPSFSAAIQINKNADNFTLIVNLNSVELLSGADLIFKQGTNTHTVGISEPLYISEVDYDNNFTLSINTSQEEHVFLSDVVNYTAIDITENIVSPTCTGDEGVVTIPIDNTQTGVTYELSIDNTESTYSTNNQFTTTESTLLYYIKKTEVNNTTDTYGNTLAFNIIQIEEEVVAIPQPATLSAFINSTDVSCNGTGDGEIGVKYMRGITGGGQYQFRVEGVSSWQDTLSMVTGLLPGTYSVYIKDVGNSCEEVFLREAEIHQPEPISIKETAIVQPTCELSNGNIEVEVEGGNNAYQYVLFREGVEYYNSGTETFLDETISFNDSLPYGDYTIEVTDPLGCDVDREVILNESSKPQINTIITSSVTCYGDNDGSAEINDFIDSTPSAAPYTYNWSNNQTGVNSTGWSSGTHWVTITDANECTSKKYFTIDSPQALSIISSNIQQPTCELANGTINLNVEGGNGAYKYTWQKDGVVYINPSDDFTTNKNVIQENLAYGEYSIGIEDHLGCSMVTSVTLNESSNPQINTISTSDVSCYGMSDGTAEVIDFVAAEPYADYIFEWSNNQSGIQSTGWSSSNTHSVTIIDANNCENTKNFAVISPAAIEVENRTIVQPTCELPNGSISIDVNGGNETYKYTWQKDGVVYINPSDDFTTNKNIIQENLAYGEYSIGIEDHLGCSMDTTVTLNESSNPQINTINTSAVSCYGLSDGTAEIGEVIAAVPYADYTFRWSNNQTGEESTGWSSGDTHSVTITDANKCESTKRFSVGSPAELEVENRTIVQPTCELPNGIISINVNGGNETYKYTWQKDGTVYSNPSDNFTTNKNVIQENLAYGEYSIGIEDHLGCSMVTSVTLNESSNPQINTISSSDVSCYGMSDGTAEVIDFVAAEPYADYVFTWSNSHKGETSTGWPSGLHTVTIQDANNCVNTDTFNINSPDLLKVKSLSIVQPTCELANGTIGIEVEGGNETYKYTWLKNLTSFYSSGTDFTTSTKSELKDSLSNGKYQINIADPLGCDLDTIIELLTYVNPSVVSAEVSITDAHCYGNNNGEVMISNISGTNTLERMVLLKEGVRYDSIYSLPTHFTGLTHGNYALKVYDNKNCESNQDYALTISQPQPLQLIVDTVRPVLQKDGNSAYIGSTVTGGNTGLKTILLKDGLDNTVATIDERSNYRFNFNNLPHGQYYLEASDSKACIYTSENINIEQPDDSLIFEIVSIEDAQCKARTGSFMIEGKGGWGEYTYKKAEDYNYFSNNEFSGLYAGKYLVSVKDKYGAVYTGEVEISEPSEYLQLNVLDKQLPSCLGNGVVELSSTGGTAPYQITDIDNNTSAGIEAGESFQFTGLEANTYTFNTTDAKGCIFNTDVTLGEDNLLRDITLTPSYPSTQGASDGSLTVHFLGGQAPFTYSWGKSDGSVLVANGETLNNISAGFYNLQITDNTGCNIKTQTYLSGAYDIALSLIEKGDETSYLANNGYAIFDFEHEDYQSASIQTPNGSVVNYSSTDSGELFNMKGELHMDGLSGGDYSILIQDKNGENYFANFSIETYNEFVFRRTETTPALQQNASNGSAIVNVTGGAPDYNFTWKNLDTDIEEIGISQGTTALLQNVIAGNYQLTVTDKYNNEISTVVEILEPEKDLSITISDYRHESCKTYEDAFIKVTAEGGWGDYQFKHADEDYYNNTMQWNDLNVRMHKIYVSDMYGVIDSVSFQITEPDFLIASVALVDSVNCNGLSDGEIEFDIEGGTEPYKFAQSINPNEWIDGSISGGLSEGNYTYYFTDANNCREKDTVNVYMPQPEVLDFALIDITHTTCNTDNGILGVNMKGGSVPYRYEWYNATNQLISEEDSISGLAQNGSYRIDVYDYHNCYTSHSQNISSSSLPQINTIITSPVLCYGDSNGTAEIGEATSASPYAPYRFIWSNQQEGEQSTGWRSDTHSVTIIDENNCESTKNFSIATPDSLIVSGLYVEQPTCELANGTINLDIAGGNELYKYTWQKDNEAFYESGVDFIENTKSTKEQVLEYGVYNLSVVDNLGCALDTTIVLNKSSNPQINTILTTPVLCFGDNNGKAEIGDITTAIPYASYKFTWSNNQTGEKSRGWSSDTHSVTLTDNNNCESTKSFTVGSPDSLKIASVYVEQPTCELANGTISLDIEGGNSYYKYTWQKNYEAFYNSGLDFIENTNSKKEQVLEYGEYSIHIVDTLGCFAETTVTLNKSNNPQINTIITSPVLCYGDSNGTAEIKDADAAIPYAPYQFIWSNLQQGDQSTGWRSDTHSVTIIDENNCESTKYFKIDTPDSLRVSITGIKDAHCFGYNDGFIQVNPIGGVGNYQYLWSNGDTSSKTENLKKGDYKLELRDENNCLYERNFTISEPDMALVDIGEDIKMCTGNTITIDGLNYSAHRWSTELDGILAEQRYLSTSNAGDYFLRITNNIGCYAYDTINVSIGNDALQADFLMSSEAYQGDTLNIYELSNLPLDSMLWEYDPISFVSVNKDDAPDYILALETMEQGMFNIGLQAYSGGCVSKVVKQVEVFALNEENEDYIDLGYQEPLIKSLAVAPNPTDGNFDVLIELREEAGVKVDIYSINQGSKVDEQDVGGLADYAINYRLSHLETGVYLVIVTADNERKQLKIIIN